MTGIVAPVQSLAARVCALRLLLVENCGFAVLPVVSSSEAKRVVDDSDGNDNE